MSSVVDIAVALAVGVGNAALEPVRPEPGPATARWGVGFGELAAGYAPRPLRPAARQLNRLGSVVVSPSAIEFDGDRVPWDRVTEIRTRRLVGYLFTDAVTKQVSRLPLWRFPGRGLLLDGLTHTALTTIALAADLRLDRGVFTLYLPADVRFQGLMRGKRMAPGISAALVLAAPSVRDLVEATAQARGVPIRPADDDALEAAAQRAASIRYLTGQAVVGVAGLLGQARTRSSA